MGDTHAERISKLEQWRTDHKESCHKEHQSIRDDVGKVETKVDTLRSYVVNIYWILLSAVGSGFIGMVGFMAYKLL